MHKGSLKQKNTLLNEKSNQCELLQCEIKDSKSLVDDLNKVISEKNSALDLATGKINSLEEDKDVIQHKVMKYSALIKQLNSQPLTQPTLNESDLTRKLKDKNKKLAETEDRARKLGNRLSELEELQSESGKSIEVK